MSIRAVFHHGGKFVYNSGLLYEGGTEAAVEEQDVDKWSYFEVVGIVKDLGYEDGSYRIWWKKEEEGNFRRFMTDETATVVAKYALEFKVAAHIYVEHFEQGGVQNEGTNEEKDVVNDEENDEEEESQSEDELKGIHMDESEEERTHGKEDGFGDDSPKSPNSQPTIVPPQTTPGGSRIMINGCYYRVKSRTKRTPKKSNHPSSSAPPEDVGQLSDGYVTEELNNDPNKDGEERAASGHCSDLTKREGRETEFRTEKEERQRFSKRREMSCREIPKCRELSFDGEDDDFALHIHV